jgi:hypothetical protein
MAPIGLPVSSTAHAQEAQPTAPYRFFGGAIERREKNAAVEACEYRVLVEEQRCNGALNKSACIARVHEACLAAPEGGDDGAGRSEIPRQAPR